MAVEVKDTKILDIEYPVGANKVIAVGDVVCTASGYAQAGAVATSLRVKGVAMTDADNTGGSNGDVKVVVARPYSPYGGERCFRFANSGDVTAAHVGETLYIAGARSASSVSTGKSELGELIRIESDGELLVKVKVG